MAIRLTTWMAALTLLAGCGDSSSGPEDAVDASDTDTTPAPPVVLATCLDGQYAEDLPPRTVSIEEEKDAYSQAAAAEFVQAVLDQRYPTGGYLVSQSIARGGFGGNCIETFLFRRDSADEVIGQLGIVVHECGHGLDFAVGGFSEAAYVITEDLTIRCSDDGETFARSLINEDDEAALRSPCTGDQRRGCDTYAPIYLDGDPTDQVFEGGDQGFDSVIEEAVQYVNSLATAYAFSDHVVGSTSARDGILTFLWYIERYLALARTEHPDVHEAILSDECWRRAILTVWGRAWLYLDATAGMPELGIQADEVEDLVVAPHLLEEIQRVRRAHGCLRRSGMMRP